MSEVFIEIGAQLRQTRESLGLSLGQLQEKTRIQKDFLKAIEDGCFEKLPSPFYVRTYLRSYANCVKLEPHHILRKYRKEEQFRRGFLVDQKDFIPTGSNSSVTDNQSITQISVLEIAEKKTRIKLNTALTIAKSGQSASDEKSNKDRLLRELYRRSYEYQTPTNKSLNNEITVLKQIASNEMPKRNDSQPPKKKPIGQEIWSSPIKLICISIMSILTFLLVLLYFFRGV